LTLRNSANLITKGEWSEIPGVKNCTSELRKELSQSTLVSAWSNFLKIGLSGIVLLVLELERTLSLSLSLSLSLVGACRRVLTFLILDLGSVMVSKLDSGMMRGVRIRPSRQLFPDLFNLALL